MRRIFTDEPFTSLWRGCDPFDEVAKLSGEEFRRVKSRRTFRVEIDGRGYFIKHHLGVGWKEILKNLFQFKLPVLGAANEFAAIRKLEELDVPTMSCVAFGERGNDPAKRESFLITRELADMVSLEDFCAKWAENPPEESLRRDLVRKLGRSIGIMHANGINHRDCYLCHFLRDKEGILHVIDLHRAQIRAKTPYRYAVKDVAGILFSALDCHVRRSDITEFLRSYTAETGKVPKKFLRAVERTAFRLYFKEFGRKGPEFSQQI